MKNETLTVVAHVAIKPNCKEAVMQACEKVVEATRQEEGNISYHLYTSTTDEMNLTFIEVWKSQAALDVHNASPHFQTFAKAIENKADLEIHALEQTL